jgi:predicted cobalt transporter CbtA
VSDEPEQEPVSAEPLVEEDGQRRYPSTIGGTFYLAVLAVVAVGIGIVTTGSWRLGIRWYAGALIAAAVLRAVLPAKDAGMLAVRQRWWDCVLLAGTGAALLFLAASIPDQPM